VATGTGIKGS